MKALFNKFQWTLLVFSMGILACSETESKDIRETSRQDVVANSGNAAAKEDQIQEKETLSLPPEAPKKDDPLFVESHKKIAENEVIQPIHLNPGSETSEVIKSLQQKGSEKVLLPPQALTEIYHRVFSRNAAGNWHYGCRNFFEEGCRASMFATGEAIAMGGYDHDIGVEAMQSVKDFSLLYMRSVRSAVARECRILVLKEWSQDDLSKNLLVKSKSQLGSETVDAFLRKLLAIPDTLKFDFPSGKYADAFTETLQENKEIDVQLIYRNLCVHLATDPLVIMR